MGHPLAICCTYSTHLHPFQFTASLHNLCSDWHEPRVAIPGFLTIIIIPLTYSIATGLSFGLISFAVLELATGRGRRQHWILYLLAVLFLIRFIYIA